VFVDWSNFEIADMDWFRGEAYQKYFDFLERKGGFYYEVCFLTLDDVRIFADVLFFSDVCVLSNRDGATHPFIPSPSPSLPLDPKSTSLKRWDITTSR
jgi:hypothetical protein